MTKIDWKPIENAPRGDKPEPKTVGYETYVLLANNKEFLGVGSYYWDNFAKRPKPYWRLIWTTRGILSQRNNQPTHWAEMPNLPEDDDNEPACGTGNST